MNDDEVLAFVQTSIKSVWALELLLLLRRTRPRAWPRPGLVQELRSSDAAVAEALTDLRNTGFIVDTGADLFRYEPASKALDDAAQRIEEVHASQPLALAKAIASAPNDKLRIFADAFRLKDR